MKFTLTINMNNAAFEEDPANALMDIVAKTMSDTAKLIEAGVSDFPLKLRDINGNVVGKATITED